ncbi:MAG TPA: ABC transporter ATP-binding protein [Tepidisphaeraceae bacterium]|jgi:ABC-2 type transport system ATP-binding protein|nr:ABC transporter ATP-binding protein [Tepidisphaeraceae bacterium]
MAGTLLVRDLVKRYGDVEAVRGVSFEVADGEVFGLLGPNGAGKTSTVECIIGLRRPDSGAIQLCGFDALTNPDQVKERIGVALQSTALQDKITPREALTLFGSFYGRHVDVQTLISRFSLQEKADAPFDSLSGGQRQRLALALAFVNEPEVLFLDEPTTGLDPQSRRDLHADILQMRKEGRTVVLTTHYIEEAHSLCDRVAIIDHGKVIAIGKPDEMIAVSKATLRVTVQATKPLDAGRLSALATVQHADVSNGRAVLKTANVSQTIIDVVRALDETGNELIDLQINRPSLEDVFIELTGSSLRD